MKYNFKLLLMFCFIEFLLAGCCNKLWQSTPYLHPSFYLWSDDANVLIQAGHEGRTCGLTGTESKDHKEAEITWTPIVVKEATKVLRYNGVNVIEAPADYYRRSHVELALYVHFDGNGEDCSQGPSIGYPKKETKPNAAYIWENYYNKDYFNYKWRNSENIENLYAYYEYKNTTASIAKMVLELGDMKCDNQVIFLKPRLEEIGDLIACSAARIIGKPDIKFPENSKMSKCPSIENNP